MTTDKLIYSGSVKNVYADSEQDFVWFEYTDDYSIFDWGKMPNPIAGKGQALAEMGSWFFKQIEDTSSWEESALNKDPDVHRALPIKTHLGTHSGNRLKVRRVDVKPPHERSIGSLAVYDYAEPLSKRCLLPVEVIFRFGVPEGSSLLKRKHWYSFEITPGMQFIKPLIEFSTKLEKTDRMLSLQEATLIVGSADILESIYHKTCAVAYLLRYLLARRGLELWDGKLEWAIYDDEIILVDSIGPDELRVSKDSHVFDKQFLRNYYKNSDWAKATEQGKELAQKRGVTDWKSIVINELNATPKALPNQLLEASEALYQDFKDTVIHGKSCSSYVDLRRELDSKQV